MKKNGLLLLLLLTLMNNMGLNAQVTYFRIGNDGYRVLTTEDGSLTDEVALVGIRADMYQETTYYGNGYVPDEVTYEGKTYRVVVFGYFDRCENTISKLTLGRNIRDIDIIKANFPLEGGYSVAEGNRYFKSIDGILYTGDGKTLLHCPAWLSHTQPGSWTKKTVIPDSVEVIADEAFQYCKRIEQIQLPANLRVIGNYAFAEFKNLAGGLIIPSKVERIGDWAFSQTGLEHVELQEGLKYLGQGAFNRTKITSLTLPASLDTILSIGNMPQLTSITCLNKIPPKVNGLYFKDFLIFTPDVVLMVPIGCRDAYANNECWGSFSKIVEIGDGDKKCAAPTIQYAEGKLLCSSVTDGARCIITVSSPDMGSYTGDEVSLKGTYLISTYARKDGYADSDPVTATLYWIERELEMGVDDIQANARPLIVSSTGNTLMVQGAEDGESVAAYDLDGRQLGRSVCRNGQATLRLNAKPESVILVKVGDDTIKVRVK